MGRGSGFWRVSAGQGSATGRIRTCLGRNIAVLAFPQLLVLNAMTPTQYEVLNRLRAAARRQGLVLEKSRTRDPRAYDYCTYQLVDPDTNTLVAWGLQSGYGLGLDDVAKALFEEPTILDEVTE